jgi:K+-transporting ATPase A subunit
MTANGLLQLALYLALLILLAKPLGSFMARVYEGDPPRWIRFLRPIERGIYRICCVQPDLEMTWRRYAIGVLAFNLVGIAAVYILQRVQNYLPWNPQGMPAVGPLLAFNTAVSFGTNTNWQSYGGETTLSYLTQMLGLTVQNFVSSAAGRSAVFNPGPHGFSEILYALSSAGNNNGSAFGGLGVGVPFYHVLLGVAMFGARYWVIIPTLALAGSLAAKKRLPTGEGTLPTHGPTFVLLLVGIVLIVGALTFLPALALGPIVETLQVHP